MKNLQAILVFAVYIGGSCFGLYLIKAASYWKTIPFFAGVGLYGLGAVVWLFILRMFPLSFAFPIAAGGLIVSTLLVGKVFLHEEISVVQFVGAMFIAIGIFFTTTK